MYPTTPEIYTLSLHDALPISLPEIGEIPLIGVRLAEVEAYLGRELARYLKEPVVHAKALIRLSIMGDVEHPGFYFVPADAVLADALMQAGGLTRDAKVREMRIERGGKPLLEGDSLQLAFARGLLRLEPILTELHPDLVLVYGDANSTVAAALTAAKLGLRVGHVEAGLRSGDWSLPEEINRVVTDRVSDLLFAPSRDAVANLGSEGIPAERVHFVGNVMIDTLCWALPHAQDLNAPARHGVAGAPYCVVTLHRPTNVDEPAALLELSLPRARDSGAPLRGP